MSTQFSDVAVLYSGKHVTVRRCRMQGQPGTVVVKQLTEDSITPRHRARIAHEYHVLQTLHVAGSSLTPRPLQWLDDHAQVALVVEDLGTSSLQSHIVGGRLPIATVLSIAEQVCLGLSQAHQAGIVHKDINPNNILYLPASGQVQLIDFGIAALMASEVQRAESVTALEGTLGYLSPEQTGRTSHMLDPRTDIYALGATLFELLTGRLVFEEADPAALVYAILTREAPDVRRVEPTVPTFLAAVVAKLLHKAPEQRYQSAHGIHADLRRCARLIAERHLDETFELAQDDRKERFELTQKVYGREQAIQVLSTAYDATVAKKCASLALVRGPSGIGKSALVGELRVNLLAQRGLLATGKCDMLSRDRPFAAFSQAVGALMRLLLTEPEEVLALWRRRLQVAVGKVGAPLVDLVPAVAHVLGPQPEAVPLPPVETESRLLYTMQRFMQALCAEQPLVLFLDDLQWADAGSIKLLRQLTAGEACGHGLLVVVAYRDNEVDASHPLTVMLQELQKRNIEPTTITLLPMTGPHIEAMLMEATGQRQEMAAPLAQLVLEKTAGNPFFVRQLLKTLHARRLLHFDSAQNAWTWDIAAARAANVTDNVLALLSETMRRQSAAVQALLSTAACIGNEFGFTALHSLLRIDRQEMAQQLDACLSVGLILAMGGDHRYVFSEAINPRYRFVHDRVQQAAYELLSEADKTRLHDDLGRQLAAALPPEGAAQEVHAVLQHLNKAMALRQDDAEKLELVALNLRGARLAMQASAHAVAFDNVEAASRLLPANAWETQPALSMESVQLRVECEYLLGNIARAEKYAAEAMQHAKSPLDRANLLQRRMRCLLAVGDYPTATHVGLDALEALGYPLRRKVNPAHILLGVMRLRVLMRGKQIAELHTLPPMQDERQLMCMEVMTHLTHSTFFSDLNLLALVNITSTIFTLTYGLSTWSRFSFASYTSVCLALNDYAGVRAWTGLATRMPSVGMAGLDARTDVFCLILCTFDTLAPRDLVDQYVAGAQLSLEGGDAVNGAMAAFVGATVLQFISIQETLDFLPRFVENASIAQVEVGVNLLYMKQLCLCMQGKTASATDFSDATTQDAELVAALPTQALSTRLTYYWYKILALWRHRALDEALALVKTAVAEGLMVMGGEQTTIFFCFHVGMLLMERCYSNPGRRLGEPKLFKRVMAKLNAGTRGPGSRFAGCYVLLEAEMAARVNDHGKAGPLFDQAIEQLQGGGYPALVAEGWERRGRYFLRTGQQLAAGHALGTALRLYRSWGATVRAQALAQEMRAVLAGVGLSAAPQPAARVTASAATSSSHTQEQGDLANLDVQAILRISQALSRERSPEQLMAKALTYMGETTGATRAALLLTRKGQGALEAACDTQVGGQFPHTLLQFVRRSGEAVVLNDLVAEHMFARDEYFRVGPARSLVCVPLQAQGVTRGVLYLENSRADHSFLPAIVESVRVLAAQTVMALDNAELYRDLEARVQQRTVVMRSEHERDMETQRTNTALQMAGGFAHEVRNALAPSWLMGQTIFSLKPENTETLLRMQAKLLEDLQGAAQRADTPTVLALRAQLTDGITAINESMGILLIGVQRALQLSEVTSAYAEAGQTLPSADSIDARSQVDRILQELRADLSEHSIEVQAQVPKKLAVTMASEHFDTVLRTLLTNARDAVLAPGSPGRTIWVTVEACDGDKKVALTVRDTGSGMDEATRKRVFQPFFSTKGAQGRGLALGISQQLMHAYGGEIAFETQEGQGSTFTAAWPNLRKTP